MLTAIFRRWLAGFLCVAAAGPAGAQSVGYRVVSPSVLYKDSLNGAQIVLRAGQVGSDEDSFTGTDWSEHSSYELQRKDGDPLPAGVSLWISNLSRSADTKEITLTLGYSGNFTSNWNLYIPVDVNAFYESLNGETFGPILVEVRRDSDRDGLIDIETLAQLHAIRWDLNGDGVVDTTASTTDSTAYVNAFFNPAAGMGCPANSCIGYELMADLDFDENDDNQITAADTTYWNGDDGWDPIGPRFGSSYAETVARINNLSFNATFEGNGHTISNLYIDRNRDWSGLFAALRDSAVVRSLGLPNAQVQDGVGSVGVLAGQNSGRVAAVWATGSVQGDTNVGGLLGSNQAGSVIVASYAMASVECRTGQAGGLAGANAGTVRASYSTGAVTGACSAANKHGLVDSTGTAVTASYWDSQSSGIEDDSDTTAPEGKTTVQLQSPTSYSSTAGNTSAIYSAWNVDVDGISGNDDPWTFGASDQYPVLKYAGMDTTAQFAAQPLGVPQGVTLTALVDTLDVRWTAVSYATGYKVQWKSDGQSYNTTDRQGTVSSGTDTTYAIAMLTPGTTYTVRVLATKTGVSDSGPSAEVLGIPPGIRYDSEGNGLIEIGTLAQLHAIRWDLNGDGALDTGTSSSDTTAYRAAFPKAAPGMGCPANSCTGYELMADLNFDENGDDQITSIDATYWNGGDGWVPIGPPFANSYGVDLSRINNLSFNATFEGNGHVIENLYIDRNRNWSGLFAALRDSAVVRSLGLPNAQVQDGGGSVAPLAGQNSGRVAAVWATGSVQGDTNVGGLLGSNQAGSVIVASYAMASVECRTGQAGGLAGANAGTVRASYSTGAVTGACSAANKHGLVDSTGTAVTASYWDSERSGIADDSDTAAPEGRTTQQLQSPLSNTGIYATWDDHDLDSDTNADDAWDFGAVDQYPVLKFGRDAEAIAAQFAIQPPGVPQGVTVTALVESLDVRWNAVRNATGYKVQWKSGMQTYDAASRQSLVSGTRDTIPTLTAGTTYTVRVIATKTGSPDSRPSAEQTGIPKSAPPGVPGNVMVTPYVLALRVTWDAATNADGYKVQWKAAGDAYDSLTREYAVGGTDTTIVGLTAGTSYTVRVLATREHADDVPSSESTGTPLAIPSLSITSPIVAEGAAGATDTLRFAITLSHASQHEVTVAYADAGTGTATSGTDYTALTAGTLTFAPGVLSDTLAVSVTGDGMGEPDETVVITLTSPTNATFAGNAGTLIGRGTITNDDSAVATLVLSPPAISENGGVATVTAILSSPEGAAVTITVSATPVSPAVGGDFSLSNARTLTIAANGTTSTGLVTITAKDNNARAGTKSVTVSGTADDTPDVVAPPASAMLMITDDESAQVTLALSPASISEAGGMATVTATLSSAENAATMITVSATPGQSAVEGDFSLSTARTLTIAANSLTSTGLVTIRAEDDTLDAPNKSVTVSGMATGGNNATAPDAVTLTITDDDDPPVLSITSPRLDEGNTGSASLQFSVTLSAASEKQITVAYAMGTGTATAGEDYTALAAGTLTFAPGTTSQTLAVSIIGDEPDEPDETVVITLSDPTNATFTGGGTALIGTGTITDDDPAVAALVLSPASISENNGITTVTATLSSAENEATTITVSATAVAPAVGGDFTLSSAKTLTIAADSLTSTGLVTIAAIDDTLDAEDKTVTVSGTAAGGNNATDPDAVTLTITDDDDPPMLSITSPRLDEGNTGSAPLQFSVTLSAASERQITVAYADAGTGSATSGTDYTALTAGTLTFAPGTLGLTLAVSIIGDEPDEPDETVVITLSNPTQRDLHRRRGDPHRHRDDHR